MSHFLVCEYDSRLVLNSCKAIIEKYMNKQIAKCFKHMEYSVVCSPMLLLGLCLGLRLQAYCSMVVNKELWICEAKF
jgi:hypothetical protein